MNQEKSTEQPPFSYDTRQNMLKFRKSQIVPGLAQVEVGKYMQLHFCSEQFPKIFSMVTTEESFIKEIKSEHSRLKDELENDEEYQVIRKQIEEILDELDKNRGNFRKMEKFSSYRYGSNQETIEYVKSRITELERDAEEFNSELQELQNATSKNESDIKRKEKQLEIKSDLEEIISLCENDRLETFLSETEELKYQLNKKYDVLSEQEFAMPKIKQLQQIEKNMRESENKNISNYKKCLGGGGAVYLGNLENGKEVGIYLQTYSRNFDPKSLINFPADLTRHSSQKIILEFSDISVADSICIAKIDLQNPDTLIFNTDYTDQLGEIPEVYLLAIQATVPLLPKAPEVKKLINYTLKKKKNAAERFEKYEEYNKNQEYGFRQRQKEFDNSPATEGFTKEEYYEHLKDTWRKEYPEFVKNNLLAQAQKLNIDLEKIDLSIEELYKNWEIRAYASYDSYEEQYNNKLEITEPNLSKQNIDLDPKTEAINNILDGFRGYKYIPGIEQIPGTGENTPFNFENTVFVRIDDYNNAGAQRRFYPIKPEVGKGSGTWFWAIPKGQLKFFASMYDISVANTEDVMQANVYAMPWYDLKRFVEGDTDSVPSSEFFDPQKHTNYYYLEPDELPSSPFGRFLGEHSYITILDVCSNQNSALWSPQKLNTEKVKLIPQDTDTK